MNSREGVGELKAKFAAKQMISQVIEQSKARQQPSPVTGLRTKFEPATTATTTTTNSSNNSIGPQVTKDPKTPTKKLHARPFPPPLVPQQKQKTPPAADPTPKTKRAGPVSPPRSKKLASAEEKGDTKSDASCALASVLKGGSPKAARAHVGAGVTVGGGGGGAVKKPLPPKKPPSSLTATTPVGAQVTGHVRAVTDLPKPSVAGGGGRFSSSFESSLSDDDDPLAAAVAPETTTGARHTPPTGLGARSSPEDEHEGERACEVSVENGTCQAIKLRSQEGLDQKESKRISKSQEDLNRISKKQDMSPTSSAMASPFHAKKPITPLKLPQETNRLSRSTSDLSDGGAGGGGGPKFPLMPKPAAPMGRAKSSVGSNKPPLALPGAKPVVNRMKPAVPGVKPGGKPAVPGTKPALPGAKPATKPKTPGVRPSPSPPKTSPAHLKPHPPPPPKSAGTVKRAHTPPKPKPTGPPPPTKPRPLSKLEASVSRETSPSSSSDGGAASGRGLDETLTGMETESRDLEKTLEESEELEKTVVQEEEEWVMVEGNKRPSPPSPPSKPKSRGQPTNSDVTAAAAGGGVLVTRRNHSPSHPAPPSLSGKPLPSLPKQRSADSAPLSSKPLPSLPPKRHSKDVGMLAKEVGVRSEPNSPKRTSEVGSLKPISVAVASSTWSKDAEGTQSPYLKATSPVIRVSPSSFSKTLPGEWQGGRKGGQVCVCVLEGGRGREGGREGVRERERERERERLLC